MKKGTINQAIRNLENQLLEIEDEETKKDIYLELYELYEEQERYLRNKRKNRYEDKKRHKEKLKRNYGVNYWIAEQENEFGEKYYKKVYNSGGRKVGKRITSKKVRKMGAKLPRNGAYYRKTVPYTWYVY